MFRPAVLIAAFTVTLLSGCDMLGIESPEKVAAAREAEGKAVGGACRHAGRAIEDCYTLNKRIDKAAIFAGWRDMNDYMRENKIEAVPPVLMAQAANPKAAPDAKADAGKAADPKAADGESDKAKPKGKDHKAAGS
ncbi:hypothetical protein [Piscinibacter sp. XHJ-5]|uniref:hypothetical protein n=1 Tax=Piscinibacter sp. XHJ-5 TaxID=3037797 RepID=UPI002452EC0D|nr:hypothetical protein [Piscinibacter sp. XHJ-5]